MLAARCCCSRAFASARARQHSLVGRVFAVSCEHRRHTNDWRWCSRSRLCGSRRARSLRAVAAAERLRRTVGTHSSRRADSSPRQRVALAVALASSWDRVRVHVCRALLLQRRALEGSSATLTDPAVRSHRADDVASGAVRLRTTRLVLGRSRLLRLSCSDDEGVSEGTTNKRQTRKY